MRDRCNANLRSSASPCGAGTSHTVEAARGGHAPAESAALAALAAWSRGTFGARLRQLALFGSRARGEGHDKSDLDVLLVVDDLTPAEGRATAYVCGDLLTAHEVLISPFVTSTAHFDHLRSRERLIAAEIDRDQIPL